MLVTIAKLTQVFSVPTYVFTRHHVTQVLPWWFKQYIARNKSTVWPPLYDTEEE